MNNAAVVWPLGPTDALNPNAIQAALTINVAAAILLSGQVSPGMRDQRWGRIVNVSSEIAVRPASMVGMTAYAAGTAGLEAHTLNLARELEGSGVTVNAYPPGAVVGHGSTRVAIGMISTLMRLAIRLQAVAKRPRDPRHGAVADVVTEPDRAIGELAHAL